MLPASGNQVCSDTQQPSGKRRSLPFKVGQAGKSLVEDLGGQVLGFLTTWNAACHERVHAVEVRFIQLRETAGIALRGLDQLPFVGRPATLSHPVTYLMMRGDKKVTVSARNIFGRQGGSLQGLLS